ncbi:hypothetical protein D3C71_666660 [compost metagenome]
MGQDSVVTQHAFLNRAAVVGHVFIQRIDVQTVGIAQQNVEQRLDILAGRGFVQSDANRVQNIAAQVNFCGFGASQHASFISHFHTQGVKVVRMAQLQPFLLQTGRQNIGETVNTGGDAFQAYRTVEHRIQTGDVGQQHLRSTNVGVRFLAADMLLASLHRHAQRGVASGVFRHADNTARHGAFEFIFRRKERRVRAAVAHRHAKALRRAEDNVRALFAWSGEQHQRHEISGDADHNFAGFQFSDQAGVIMDFTGGTDLLQQHAEHILMIQHFFSVINNYVKAEGFRAGADHIQGLRMNIGSHEEAVSVFQLADALRHRHRFGGGGRFIEQRSRGDIQTGQIQRHLLEVQQRFQTTLRHFRLIRGVGGVPAWIFQHVAQDNWR